MLGKSWQLAFLPEPEKPEKLNGHRLRKWEPDWRELREGDVPPGLRDIYRLIGKKGAVSLVRWRGGAKLTVPKRVGERHPIAQALGCTSARVLAGYYGGEKIDIPKADTVFRPLRNRTIRAEYDAGARVIDLVWRFNCGERRIRDILNMTET